jgi:recombination protein RecR
MLPDPIRKFIDIASSLPSIGPRQATRLAFYLIQQGKGTISEIMKSLAGLGNLKPCANCFFPHENTKQVLCHICGDPKRNKSIIAIVEKETDLISLENTKKFMGRYLILGDLKKGILESNQKLRLNNLKAFIQKEFGGKAEEVIIAFNPTTYGNLNALAVANELKDYAKKITRLGRGIPTGGEIEFADEETLSEALDKRS